MARYKSIKEVDGFEILEIKGRVLVLDNGEEYEMPDGMDSRYTPKVGDYLVEYRDGFRSVSPKKEFDDGYVQIEGKPESFVSRAECVQAQTLGIQWDNLDYGHVIALMATSEAVAINLMRVASDAGELVVQSDGVAVRQESSEEVVNRVLSMVRSGFYPGVAVAIAITPRGRELADLLQKAGAPIELVDWSGESSSPERFLDLRAQGTVQASYALKDGRMKLDRSLNTVDEIAGLFLDVDAAGRWVVPSRTQLQGEGRDYPLRWNTYCMAPLVGYMPQSIVREQAENNLTVLSGHCASTPGYVMQEHMGLRPTDDQEAVLLGLKQSTSISVSCGKPTGQASLAAVIALVKFLAAPKEANVVLAVIPEEKAVQAYLLRFWKEVCANTAIGTLFDLAYDDHGSLRSITCRGSLNCLRVVEMESSVLETLAGVSNPLHYVAHNAHEMNDRCIGVMRGGMVDEISSMVLLGRPSSDPLENESNLFARTFGRFPGGCWVNYVMSGEDSKLARAEYLKEKAQALGGVDSLEYRAEVKGEVIFP